LIKKISSVNEKRSFGGLLSSSSFPCRSWHLVLLNRLPRFHRAVPSTSLDKSEILDYKKSPWSNPRRFFKWAAPSNLVLGSNFSEQVYELKDHRYAGEGLKAPFFIHIMHMLD
jgi:hypothetical protein